MMRLILWMFFFLFITLKLAHQIDWNWFWVLSPIAIPFLLWLGCQVILQTYRIFFETKEQAAYRRAADLLDQMSKQYGTRGRR